jgi:hypothetical protein
MRAQSWTHEARERLEPINGLELAFHVELFILLVAEVGVEPTRRVNFARF